MITAVTTDDDLENIHIRLFELLKEEEISWTTYHTILCKVVRTTVVQTVDLIKNPSTLKARVDIQKARSSLSKKARKLQDSQDHYTSLKG